MDKFKFLPKSKIDLLPKTTGVYLFYSKKLNPKPYTLSPIYIGKAINIKNRVKNHFNQPSYRDNLFVSKINKISFYETNSEIEALISEANLIKKYQPKYNVIWRDDKNYFYVSVLHNKQGIPYVSITHQPNIKLKATYVGPFVEGRALKKTLKFLRRVFPYYTSARHSKNKCTWCHLDLCPGPRLFEAGQADLIAKYKKNIKKLVLILKGKRSAVLNSLKKEMKQLSKQNRFEEAGKTRDRIYALQQIMAHAKIISTDVITNQTIVGNLTIPILSDSADSKWKKTQKILQGLLKTESPVSRIECYDVSNIQGKQATGAMVVFINGKPDKSQYKKFKIKILKTPNDVAMLKQILQRRFHHPEWSHPDIILIDGGKAQLNTAVKTIQQLHVIVNSMKVISISKGKQELFIQNRKKPIPLKSLPREIYNLIKQLDEEAHRFAITYHKKLRSRKLLN